MEGFFHFYFWSFKLWYTLSISASIIISNKMKYNLKIQICLILYKIISYFFNPFNLPARKKVLLFFKWLTSNLSLSLNFFWYSMSKLWKNRANCQTSVPSPDFSLGTRSCLCFTLVTTTTTRTTRTTRSLTLKTKSCQFFNCSRSCLKVFVGTTRVEVRYSCKFLSCII